MIFHDCKTTHPEIDLDGASRYVLIYPTCRLLPLVAMYVEKPYVRILSSKKKLETHWVDTSGEPLYYLTPYMWAEIEYPNEKGGES